MQAAAGALEELRRSATPDISQEGDAEPEQASSPVLQPSRKGKRSRPTRTAPSTAAAEPAAVSAAEALAKGPADAATKPAGQSALGQTRPKRRASAKGKASTVTAEKGILTRAHSSGDNAELATAPESADTAAPEAEVSGQSGSSMSSQQADAEQQRRQSDSKARGKSRLSKASSPEEPTASQTDAAGLPVKRRVSAKVSHAGSAQDVQAEPAVVCSRKSGTGSTAAKQTAVLAASQPEHKSSIAGKVTRDTVAAADEETAAAEEPAAKGGKAKRKSAPAKGSTEAPAATEPAASSGRRGSRAGRGASQGVDSAAAQAASAPALAARAPDAVPAGRARKGRASGSGPDKASQAEATRAHEEEGGDHAGPSSRGDDTGAAAEAVVSGPAKGPELKAGRGKRSRQDMAGMQDEGPASHVKAARKSTDIK